MAFSRSSFAFVDESGVLEGAIKEQPYFGVGLLKLKSVAAITDELYGKHYDFFSSQKEARKNMIKSLRTNPRSLDDQELNLLLIATRHCEYKFTNITPTTLKRYKEILDTLFAHDFHFCSLVVDKTNPLFSLKYYKNYWHAYITFTKHLCKNNCATDEKLIIVADYMNRPRGEELLFEEELCRVPSVENVIRAHSETFTLLQVSDLLLGAVLFHWRVAGGYTKPSNRSAAKTEFVEYLCFKLGLEGHCPLSTRQTVLGPHYFSVWPFKLK